MLVDRVLALDAGRLVHECPPGELTGRLNLESWLHVVLPSSQTAGALAHLTAAGFNAQENGHGVLAEGMPRVELPEPPVQITGSAGDLVLAHHQIVHTAAPNGSANIRYAAITRLRHLDIKENGPDVYTDIWREYPGLRAEFEQEAA